MEKNLSSFSVHKPASSTIQSHTRSDRCSAVLPLKADKPTMKVCSCLNSLRSQVVLPFLLQSGAAESEVFFKRADLPLTEPFQSTHLHVHSLITLAQILLLLDAQWENRKREWRHSLCFTLLLHKESNNRFGLNLLIKLNMCLCNEWFPKHFSSYKRTH